MHIEIVWIGPDGARIKEYEVEARCTVDAALRLAALDPLFARAQLLSATVGVFGRLVGRDELLTEGDRIEVYRGPAVDPKLARRARAGKSQR
jgi:putative ubiquitin-RnfH superfamily antitoxin RatB of RatAB toxin-antitoxin module